MIKEVTQLEELADYNGLVLVSAVWCSPCKQYKPLLEAYARGRQVELRVIDAGTRPELSGKLGVRAVPTTILFVNGEPANRLQGAQTVPSLDRMLA